MVKYREKEASIFLIQKELYVSILSFNDKMKGFQYVNSLQGCDCLQCIVIIAAHNV